MLDAPDLPFAIGLSPGGHIVVDPAPPDGQRWGEAEARQLVIKLGEDDAGAILELAARSPSAPLPPSLSFFRDLGRRALAAAAATATLSPPPPTDLGATLDAAPPMYGLEYLDTTMLQRLWGRLTGVLAATLADVNELEAWLRHRNDAWAVVGRVCFHLAENKRDPLRPFAFMATYSVGLSGADRTQHRPLGVALAESAAENDREGLLRLLLPVQRAAASCAWLAEMFASQAIFRPQAWTAEMAHRFLVQIPALQAAGLVVRVPDWWRPGAPPRVQVGVSLGRTGVSAIGTSGLLSFDVGLVLDGEPLTEAEWSSLRTAGEGLVPLRGRWVELDRARLDAVLDAWNQARAEAGAGLSFHAAMRLLAGADRPPRLGPAPTEDPGWSRIAAGPWLEEVLRQLRTPGSAETALPGPLLHATLRPYQADGVRWLDFVNRLSIGVCLADDMGLGKTIQVLGLLLLIKAQRRARGPHLIVAPASLLGNWRSEAARFAPSLRIRTAHASGDGVSEGVREEADVVLTTYGAVATCAWMRVCAWDTVILDEAQAIKNPGTRQTRAVVALDARVRVALTGTPVENRAGDLWSLFHFLQPGLLGTAAAFKRATGGDAPNRFGPLRTLVRPYILRRLKTDPSVAPDLPSKTEIRTECGLTREQAVLYQQAVDHLAKSLAEAEGMERRGLVLATLLRLKQVCNHPSHWLGDGGWQMERSGKLQRVAELMEPIVMRQEKVLVFTQFRETIEPIAAHLARLFGRVGLVLHGGTPIRERQRIVDRFQQDEGLPYVVLSLKAGGTGLNLTAATHVVHFDRWWNPAVEEQATDRAFRIGQKKPVFVHKLVCRGTVEERVDRMLVEKRQIARELLAADDELKLTELTDAELLRTLSLDLERTQID